jgi:hypothetical protein
MNDKISEVPRETAVKSDSPHYHAAKKIVDDLNLHNSISVHNYPQAINTVIATLEANANQS